MSSLQDDPAILDEAELWRRINPDWLVPDGAGGVKISSAAFDDSKDGSPLSVLIAEKVAETDRTATDILAPYPGYSLAAITAGDARARKQEVASTPTEEEPAHGSVIGCKTKSIKRALAKAARLVVAPS